METVYKSVVSGRFDKLRQNYDGRAAAAVSLEMISHCIIKAAAAQAGVSRRHGPFAGRRRPCAGKRYVKTNKNGELKLEDAPMAQWPDLLLIDGGKGQLGVVVDLLETLQLDIPVFGLAERFEELYRPHDSEPIILSRRSPGLQLLQRVRDEAHRFGITYQRKLRTKGQKESALDQIPGIGPTRRSALLRAFGSLEQIFGATLEELELTPGMNKQVAKDLYEYLHSQEQFRQEFLPESQIKQMQKSEKQIEN